jgi:hypothetical protein
MKSNLAKIIGSLAFITSLFVLSNNAVAQWHPVIGLKGGINVDNLSTTPVLGVNAGIYAAMEYSDIWGVNLEAFYAERHFQGSTARPTTRVSYLEVPVYFNYFFLRKYTTIRPKIVVGPSFNFLLENEVGGAANFELASIVGLGFNKDLTKDGHITMFFDARYMKGWTTVNQRDTPNTRDSYNNTLRFHVGFGFSLTGGRKGK